MKETPLYARTHAPPHLTRRNPKSIRKMLLKRMPKALQGASQGVRRSKSAAVSRSLDSGKVLREVDYKIDEIKGHISTDVLEVRLRRVCKAARESRVAAAKHDKQNENKLKQTQRRCAETSTASQRT